MDIESLYPLVTEAIRRAELLAEARAPEATSAHQEVSLLEEKIAELLPASEAEGALARRGAVRAALAAGDFSRARQLASRYQAEQGASQELRDVLAAMKVAEAPSEG